MKHVLDTYKTEVLSEKKKSSSQGISQKPRKKKTAKIRAPRKVCPIPVEWSRVSLKIHK